MKQRRPALGIGQHRRQEAKHRKDGGHWSQTCLWSLFPLLLLSIGIGNPTGQTSTPERTHTHRARCHKKRAKNVNSQKCAKRAQPFAQVYFQVSSATYFTSQSLDFNLTRLHSTVLHSISSHLLALSMATINCWLCHVRWLSSLTSASLCCSLFA